MYKYNYVIRAINEETGEILDQSFETPDNAEMLEIWLNFVGAKYEAIARGDENFPYYLNNELV